MKTYFVTGGTGFLGKKLLERLVASGANVYALARRKQDRELPDLGVTWVEGDIEHPDLGVCGDASFLEGITDVIHAAALYDLSASSAALYWANIVGTHHVVHFASRLPNLKAFHFISTMAVAGDYAGTFTEGMFSEGQNFPNAYASTKFAAEACVREWATSVPRIICRLGIVVGDSRTGEIPKIDGPYYLMRAVTGSGAVVQALKRLPAIPLPFNIRARAYLIPVDAAAEAICHIAENTAGLPPKPLRVYHVMGESGGVPIRSVLKRTLRSAGIEGKIVPLPPGAQRSKAVAWIAEKLAIPPETLHYLYSPCQFEMKRLHADFPELGFPRFEEYSDTLFGYAKESLFQGAMA